jgi:hypothetical protein
VEVQEPTAEAWVRAVSEVLRSRDAQARADAAYHYVLAHHTYDHRAATVLQRLAETRKRPADVEKRARALGVAYARWAAPASVRDLPLTTRDRAAVMIEAAGWRVLIAADEARRAWREQRRASGP